MWHRFVRHIKDGFIGVGRHIGMSLSSATAVNVTLLLIGIFLILTFNMASMSYKIEDSINLSALVKYEVTDKTKLTTIENSLKAVEGVDSVTYRSKDEEFDFYVEQYPEVSNFTETYRDQNPFHDAFMIGIKQDASLEDVKAQIEKIDGIDSVHDGGTNTYKLIEILKDIRIFGGILVLALCLLAIYLVRNTIKITIEAREQELFIMRNVGARVGYIRAPFLVEGIIIGLMGSVLPILFLCIGYALLYQKTGGLLLGVIELLAPNPLMIYISLCLVIIAVVVGFVGSFISVSMRLRKSR